MKKFIDAAAPFISIAAIIAMWKIISAAVGIEFLLPSPENVWKELIAAASSQKFYISLLTTVGDAIKAFIPAFFAAGVFAVVASYSKTAEKLLRPFVLIIQSAPTMSIIFLSIIWLTSAESPVLVGFLVLFPLLYHSFLTAIKSVEKELSEMSRVYNVRKRDVIFKLYAPCVADKAYSDSASALALGVKLAVAGEALAQTGNSLGFLLQSSKSNLETGALLAYTVAAVILGGLLQLLPRLAKYAFTAIRRALREKATRNGGWAR